MKAGSAERRKKRNIRQTWGPGSMAVWSHLMRRPLMWGHLMQGQRALVSLILPSKVIVITNNIHSEHPVKEASRK